LVDQVKLPLLGQLGRRKSWIVFCQVFLIVSFLGLGMTNPATAIGWFAIFAVIGAFASATQDIAVDAWRIDVADERTPVELLSAVYQFGYRIASIVGGAFALFLAARIPWGTVYFVMAGLVVAIMVVALTAPDTERPPRDIIEQGLEQPGEVNASVRLAALVIVGLAWAWAIVTLGVFMASMLADDSSIRASAGASILWNSPLGPLRLDIAKAFIKQDYDKEQLIRFGASTKF